MIRPAGSSGGPLHGLRIGITRPAGQAEETLRRARQLGAEPIVMPTIAVAPLTDWSDVDRFSIR